MMGKDMITMKQKELKQLHIIREVLEKRIKQKTAGKIAGLSVRQLRRKQKRVQVEGNKGIIHRSRGMPTHNDRLKGQKEKTIQIYRDKYWDFGPTLASEKLLEIDEIKISDETLRLWLIESGDWKKRRKGRKHRNWRERKAHYGEMVQADGSHHEWFEDRGDKCVLMGYIDDATGRTYGRFYEYEGTIPAMDSFKRYIKKYGIPQSIYMDKHPTYKSTKKQTIEDELADRNALSQFERAVEELGVEFIHANSAPAKGRIERLFKTFQDRLIKEMRLAGISSIKEGNEFLEEYLPKYNKRFGVEAEKALDLHRAVPEDMKLDAILCIKEQRVLRNDYTVSYKNKFYQVLVRTNAKKVTVEERISGKIHISYKGKLLKSKRIAQLPKKEQAEVKKEYKTKAHMPAEGHPWTKWIDRGYPQNLSYSQRKKKEAKKKEKLLLLVH
ncbi:MAG: ISNCY family transposase [Candidatus Omnitrophica bacterium]|nr:ISNCY family transposase [Candidatus Omnitrophota bacterium]